MLLAMFFTFHIALHQLFVPLFIFSIFHTQWYKPNSLLYIPANKFGLSQLMYIHHNPLIQLFSTLHLMLTNSEIEIVCCATADDAIAMNNAAIMILNVFICMVHLYLRVP